MALKLIQLTLTAAARDPLTSIAARESIRHAILEADDGNLADAFVGDDTVTAANGLRLVFGAAPGRVELGPFSGDSPVYTSEINVAGATGEVVNALIVTH